ncbi:hypothetical protein B5X24_HaOG207416 [Helicoverpa armigera]|uniref:Uncharacterized protein n=1 Tax=Helicoverpa armigera TaxID=29058 RepID=A0A2W1BLT7_HELAM|nr:hypothetical protein B5X24_HaOG207416 [Helicoverpa armigera]
MMGHLIRHDEFIKTSLKEKSKERGEGVVQEPLRLSQWDPETPESVNLTPIGNLFVFLKSLEQGDVVPLGEAAVLSR